MELKLWEVAPLDRDLAAQLAECCSVPFFLAMLLEIRGFRSEEQVKAVLGSGTPLSDPYLMKDMEKAAARIRRAIDNFEKIAVYGDYDADGVTATAMLFSYLETVGADVMYYIPQREGEGYGMNRGAVEALHAQGVSLIVTVDNGISSGEEAALARELGMDVVVTDHHRPQEKLPEAAAVVDAYRADDESPFKDLSGAGVVLKLLVALEDGDADGILEEYSDLAAVGTVGDVVPLVGENRLIVREGLCAMARGGRLGVSALLDRCSAAGGLSAGVMAFTVIPRLNATGRMGSPERAVRLLCCEYEEEAQALAEEICQDNDRRRQVEAKITAEAMERIENDPSLLYSRVIVVSGKGWHHGVIGIAAARITERFGKPCFVVSEDGELAKGSGRSVEGFSLFEAVSACSGVLERFGGHPMAAGVTLKAGNIGAFREEINRYALSACPEMPAPVLHIDCRLNPASLNASMPRDLHRLEPFGSGNPQPLFGLFGMELREIVPVGGGGHLRLVCQKHGAFVNCMRFGVKLEDFPFSIGDRLDLAVTLELREYRGEERLSVTAREIRPAGLNDTENLHSYRVYEKFRRKELLSPEEKDKISPSRDDLAALYRLFASFRGAPFGMQRVLGTLGNRDFTLGKLLLCFDILEERQLAQCGPRKEIMTVLLQKTTGKVDLFASQVFSELQALTEK